MKNLKVVLAVSIAAIFYNLVAMMSTKDVVACGALILSTLIILAYLIKANRETRATRKASQIPAPDTEDRTLPEARK